MSLLDLPTFDGDDLNVIIETPKGRRNKFAYDPAYGLFRLKSPLPSGAVFPFDFGFLPGTRGEDGDPLDVLVMMDEPAHVGCLVPSRLIGIVEAMQTERDGTTTRNDRLIAAAASSREHRDLTSLDQLTQPIMDEIEHFFVSYNTAKGKRFEVLGRFGPERARETIARGSREFADTR